MLPLVADSGYTKEVTGRECRGAVWYEPSVLEIGSVRGGCRLVVNVMRREEKASLSFCVKVRLPRPRCWRWTDRRLPRPRVWGLEVDPSIVMDCK